ncbi:MerR family transcriptional regulator [Sulfobacillus thermosulfidooxidans]|uniref:MerR family transcriptional regulator n=1 Tax=Sulfobacillus thermosulfidooxidans TaxID=28034 RepID=UPI0009DAE6C2
MEVNNGTLQLHNYSIRTRSRQSGVTVKTIRYYSNQGLLPPAAIAKAGYRLYSDRELERLYQIMGLRSLGTSGQQIRLILGGQVSLRELLNSNSRGNHKAGTDAKPCARGATHGRTR